MKGVIIYKGRYGATAQYANWLATRLDLEASSAEGKAPDPSGFDYLILGSSVYIGKLELTKWIRHHLDILYQKKVFFFLVSGTPAGEVEKLKSYLRSGIPDDLRSSMEVFYLPGKLEIKKLSWWDRFMLRMGARLAKEPGVKQTMLTDYNHLKPENLQPLVDSVKAFRGE